MKVLAFTKYAEQAASTRQRLLQYRLHPALSGIEIEYHALLGNDYIQGLSEGRGPAPARLAVAYARRFWQLITRRDFDLLWIHLELFPYLPGLLERLAFVGGKPVVYDFDDAVFHTYGDHRNGLVRWFLGRKLEPLMRGVAAVSCGNRYLQNYARKFNGNCPVFPTVVDSEIYRPLAREGGEGRKTVVGWIGSPSTWVLVEPYIPLLRDLALRKNCIVRVIGAGAGVTRHPELEFVEWIEAREVSEVQKMDIGIMPLPDQPWTRGKCGYKLVQYMACGLPVVASPVEVNRELVRHGENGFLASSDREWGEALGRLVDDAALRNRMGAEGRRRVEAEYSLQVHAPRFADLLRSAAGQVSGPK